MVEAIRDCHCRTAGGRRFQSIEGQWARKEQGQRTKKKTKGPNQEGGL